MVDYADELLSGDIDRKKPKERDWASEILDPTPGGEIVPSPIAAEQGKPREFVPRNQPTGAIDTRTGEPVTKLSPTGQEPAGFGTEVKAGIVDDLQTRVNIYAKARGISPARYGVHNGEIVYIGDDGKLYSETADTVTGKIKRGAAQTVSRGSEVVMGTVLPFLGAAGGEGIRKSIGNLVFDEPQTSWGNIQDMALSGALSKLGQKVGEKIVGGIDISRGREGARLVKAAGRGRERISLPEVNQAEAMGRQYGIDLLPPQTTKSPELISRFNILGDLPETADLIGAVRRKQNEQVVKAIDDYLGTLAPPTTTPGEAGRRVVEAADTAVETANTVRRNRASPFYKKAFEADTKVDIEPVLDLINTELKTAKGPILDHLLAAKKLLLRPDLPKKTPASVLVNAQGQPLTQATESFETSLESLHGVKMALDDILKNAKATGLGNTIKRNYTRVKDSLLTQMDAASPDYKMARSIFSEESLIPEELAKTKVGAIAGLEGDAVGKVATKLFAPGQSSPEIVSIAKPMIIKYGGQEAWDGLIRTHLQNAFNSIKESVTGGITNFGGRFRQKVFGDIQQRNILKEAMTPEQFEYLENFANVLDRTGLILGKESTTATRQVQLKQMHREAESGLLTAITTPMRTPQRLLADRLNELLFTKSNERLAKAMVSDTAAQQLRNMLRLKPGSQKLIEQLSTFVTIVGGEQGREALDRSKTSNVRPPILKEQSGYRGQGQLLIPEELRQRIR